MSFWAISRSPISKIFLQGEEKLEEQPHIFGADHANDPNIIQDSLLLEVEELLSRYPTMDSFYTDYTESFDPYFK